MCLVSVIPFLETVGVWTPMAQPSRTLSQLLLILSWTVMLFPAALWTRTSLALQIKRSSRSAHQLDCLKPSSAPMASAGAQCPQTVLRLLELALRLSFFHGIVPFFLHVCL